MKRWFSIGLWLGLIAAIGYLGGQWFMERQRYETTDNAYLKAHQVLLAPQVAGRVSVVRISENQPVKQGELLIEIDDRDYRAKLALAQAQVAQAQAQIARLRSAKVSQQANIASAGANVAAINAKRQQIDRDLQRFHALTERGSAPRQVLDQVAANAKQAEAELRGSQAAVSAQQQQLAVFDGDIAAAEAQLKQAQAAVELAELDVERCRLRAPFDGVIGKRGVEVGQFVDVGTQLAYLISSEPAWVEANFKETQLQQMQIGQPVEIEVDAYPDLQFSGKVDSFSPASGSEFSLLPPENAAGNFTKIVRRVPVKIVLNNSANIKLLKPGLSTAVKVKVK